MEATGRSEEDGKVIGREEPGCPRPSRVKMFVDLTTQMLNILKVMIRIGIKRKGTHILYDGQVVIMEQGWAPMNVIGLKRRWALNKDK